MTPEEEYVTLEPGYAPPPFALESPPNRRVALSDLIGRPHTVLAFYPADDTPNSTRELIELSAMLEHFDRVEKAVFNVSCDTTESHAAFAAKHGVPVPLLADPRRIYGPIVRRRSRRPPSPRPRPVRHRQDWDPALQARNHARPRPGPGGRRVAFGPYVCAGTHP
jgi:hypothetical protein